jgi:hypothetical protein
MQTDLASEILGGPTLFNASAAALSGLEELRLRAAMDRGNVLIFPEASLRKMGKGRHFAKVLALQTA